MLQVAPTIRSNHTSDGATVLDIHRGKTTHRLNPVGSKILEGLRNGFDHSQIAVEISTAFHVNLAIAEWEIFGNSWKISKDTTSSSPAPLAVRFRRSIPLSGSIAADRETHYVIVLGENRDGGRSRAQWLLLSITLFRYPARREDRRTSHRRS